MVASIACRRGSKAVVSSAIRSFAEGPVGMKVFEGVEVAGGSLTSGPRESGVEAVEEGESGGESDGDKRFGKRGEYGGVAVKRVTSEGVGEDMFDILETFSSLLILLKYFLSPSEFALMNPGIF